jgi:peptide/nickel transport system permease protein
MVQSQSVVEIDLALTLDSRRWYVPIVRETQGIVREPRGFIAVLILVMLMAFGFVLPVLDSTDPNFIGRDAKNDGPSWEHPMGTDHLSRDLLARNSVGLRRTISNGLGAVAVGWLAGIGLGYLAGWYGRWIDTLIMRGVDTLLAFPGILLAIVLITIIGPGLFSVAVAIAVFNIPTSARLARAGVLRERERQYVEAARCIGATGPRILFRHVAINTFGAFAVQLPIAVVASVLTMAALNFLGLGDKPPNPSLGQLLLDGSRFMRDAPHYVLGPVVLLALMMAALNFLSDVLSERLDPVRRRALGR